VVRSQDYLVFSLDVTASTDPSLIRLSDVHPAR
jgi:hypothetical protein